MTEFREALEGLFIEVAIVEHLARTRVERLHNDGMEAALYGILSHLNRVDSGAETIRTIAFNFQEDEARVTRQVRDLEALGFVSLVPGVDPLDTLVSLSDTGRAARAAKIERMAPDFLSIVAEIPEEDIVTTYRVLKDIRHVMDNLPDR
jgi:DNA-binding MarR family transcriptional regulator